MKKYRVKINGNLIKKGDTVIRVPSKLDDENSKCYKLINGNDIDFEYFSDEEVEPIEEHDHSSYHEEMKQLYDSNYELFVDKNRKYGNSFRDTFRDLGQISALTRMTDKFNRLTTMMLSGETDNEESVIDTLLDLSNYALMTVYELKQKEKENEYTSSKN